MNRIIDLQTALLDLLQKVDDPEMKLIAGGGGHTSRGIHTPPLPAGV